MKYRERKYKLRRREGRLKAFLKRALAFAGIKVFAPIPGESIRYKTIRIPLFAREFELTVIRVKSFRRFWRLPHPLPEPYAYCPDERINTLRLLGKPAQGPSPPSTYLSQLNTPDHYTTGLSTLHLKSL